MAELDSAEKISNKRVKTDNLTGVEGTVSSLAEKQNTAKGVDSLLLSSLQTELKYQVYSLWRQLNLIETYDDHPKGVQYDENEMISADVYKEQLAEDTSVLPKCCIECFAHISGDQNLFKHHRHHKQRCGDHIKNYHYVPVLEMDHSNALTPKFRPMSSEIIKKVYNFEFTLYCRLCFSPVEKATSNLSTSSHQDGLFSFSLDQHLRSIRHTSAVKQYFKSTVTQCIPPKCFQLIKGPVKLGDDVEDPHPANKYHPHVFLMGCCCRMAACRFCETPPYIFESVMSSDLKFIKCMICKVSFPSTFGTHFMDIATHVRSRPHCLSRRDAFIKNGYIPHDTKIFKVANYNL